MNVTITPSDIVARSCQLWGVPLEDFARRALDPYLADTKRAAQILKTMTGQPEQPYEHWAVKFASREPAVQAILERDQ